MNISVNASHSVTAFNAAPYLAESGAPPANPFNAMGRVLKPSRTPGTGLMKLSVMGNELYSLILKSQEGGAGQAWLGERTLTL